MIGLNFGKVLAAFIGLLVIGILYNKFINKAIKMGYLEGYENDAITLVVFITIAAGALIDPRAALLYGILFTAIGAPLWFGHFIRFVTARRQAKERIRQDLKSIKNGSGVTEEDRE